MYCGSIKVSKRQTPSMTYTISHMNAYQEILATYNVDIKTILQENHVRVFKLQKTVTLEIHNANKSIGKGNMKKIQKHIELKSIKSNWKCN
uniref:Putative ovule protein n=1 Tax=Solanum chacoense TaxID=4108 RepID=A0A0V0J0U8_SOLCH